VILPVETFAANGKQSLNRLSQPRGQPHSWNQEYYTVGVQWPYKRVWMLSTYYRREDCSNCTPDNWNVAGASLNFYFRNSK
jgi:hypothetical protein